MSESSQQDQKQEFYSYITNAANITSKQLEISREKSESRAVLWEWSAWIAAIVGLIIFFVMFVVVVIQKDNSEWFRPLAGLIFDAVALLFFKRSDKANERVDKIQMRLDETEKILLAIKLVEIADSETQKKYHERFIERLLYLPTDEQEIAKPGFSLHERLKGQKSAIKKKRH